MNDRRRLRRLLSLEAARLMDESGFRDPQLALRKAVARLAAQARPSEWPDQADIAQALGNAAACSIPWTLSATTCSMPCGLRQWKPCGFLPPSPRAAGAAIDGLVTNTPVAELHLHADDAESVQRHLADHRIAARPGFRRVFDHRDIARDVPVWHVTVEGIDFELLVLPEAMLRHAPGRMRAHPP
jgi:hypothetical protein